MSEPLGYAHVVDGAVVNVSMWDGVTLFDPGEGVALVPLPYVEQDGERFYTAGIGWDYADGQFIDNRPTEPDFD
jgi:hypothetical protein